MRLEHEFADRGTRDVNVSDHKWGVLLKWTCSASHSRNKGKKFGLVPSTISWREFTPTQSMRKTYDSPRSQKWFLLSGDQTLIETLLCILYRFMPLNPAHGILLIFTPCCGCQGSNSDLLCFVNTDWVIFQKKRCSDMKLNQAKLCWKVISTES